MTKPSAPSAQSNRPVRSSVPPTSKAPVSAVISVWSRVTTKVVLSGPTVNAPEPGRACAPVSPPRTTKRVSPPAGGRSTVTLPRASPTMLSGRRCSCALAGRAASSSSSAGARTSVIFRSGNVGPFFSGWSMRPFIVAVAPVGPDRASASSSMPSGAMTTRPPVAVTG